MDKNRRNAHLLLMLAAAIWGFAFVAQRVGMRHIGPLTFNGVRFALGAGALAPLLLIRKGWFATWTAPPASGTPPTRRELLVGSLGAGLLLFGGSTLQQVGVIYTTAGKAGFITSLYVVFVPLLGLFWGQATGGRTWLGVFAAAVGLYLLSARGMGSIDRGDGLVLIGAWFWAGHVLLVGHLVQRLPALPLAVLQFTVCSALSLIGALILETIRIQALLATTVPILYAGLMSVGVAYTLQAIGQRHARPAPAAIILSFEAVFAALGGWLILSEGMTLRGMLGAALMLAGVILAQTDRSQLSRN